MKLTKPFWLIQTMLIRKKKYLVLVLEPIRFGCAAFQTYTRPKNIDFYLVVCKGYRVDCAFLNDVFEESSTKKRSLHLVIL